MLKTLAIGFLIFLILALLTGIWGQLQRLQSIMERGMWQRDQYLKKMCDLMIENVDVVIGGTLPSTTKKEQIRTGRKME